MNGRVEDAPRKRRRRSSTGTSPDPATALLE
jgi:hypothetical protein